ncbi:MAG: energy transducer TonB [Opitutaceae bacterium]|jgi:hypothetical protein|nr:energy transducer TonB [Opitutaceae bacterium]
MKTSMLKLITVFVLIAMTSIHAVHAAGEPVVILEPFEPSYKAGDKFSRPKEVVAPRFLWPYEMRRNAISGEVVVLVELDGCGRAKRLATLYSTHPLFTKSAIQALKQARWDSTGTDWFYYKVIFDVEKEKPNQSSETTPTVGPWTAA